MRQTVSYDLSLLQEIIATAAKQELLPRYKKVERQLKADGSFLTEADLAIQTCIEAQLKQHWPDTVFLGEEMDSAQQAAILASDKPVWCLDPLDGTSNFSAGIPHFAVSLALLCEGEVLLGVVYDPMREECFSARKGGGAWLNNQALKLEDSGLALNQSTALIDFKRLDNTLASRLVTEQPYASQRSFGSVALDWSWLAAGRCHVYLHGKQNIWDYAAGHLVFEEAGGYSVTLSGEPVFINKLLARAALAACDEKLFIQWCDYLDVTVTN